MRPLPLSGIILSANFIVNALSPTAFAQDAEESDPNRIKSESTLDPQDEPAPPTSESVFEIPKKATPQPKPADESGPEVNDQYNPYSEPSGGLLGDFRVGPVVSLGLPHPLNYGVEALFAKAMSFGFNTGSYNVTQIDKANIKIKNWDAYAQWHPFFGSFFVGGAYGHQDIKGRFEDNIQVTLSGFPTTVPARVDAEIKSNYFTPRLGWLSVWDSGFTMGFELGAQIPLGPKSKVNASLPGMSASAEGQVKATEDYKDLKKQADDAVELLGKKTFPYISLLKIGWLF